MRRASDAAKEVFEKIRHSDPKRKFAVFMKGVEEVQVMGESTGACKETERKRPRDLVGVYDRSVTLDRLASDLHYMGMAV